MNEYSYTDAELSEFMREYFTNSLIELLPLLTERQLTICRDIAMGFANNNKR